MLTVIKMYKMLKSTGYSGKYICILGSWWKTGSSFIGKEMGISGTELTEDIFLFLQTMYPIPWDYLIPHPLQWPQCNSQMSMPSDVNSKK